MIETYDIDIANRQRHLALDEDFLREVIRRVLGQEQIPSATISLVIVDDAAIHQINREFLDHDCPTDVISFLLEEETLGSAVGSSDGISDRTVRRIEGEVIVSAETADREAVRWGWKPEHELLLYVVHGLLHLCGYDDLSAAERRRMRTRENEMLQLWGLTPPFADLAGGEPVPEDGEPPGDGADTQ